MVLTQTLTNSSSAGLQFLFYEDTSIEKPLPSPTHIKRTNYALPLVLIVKHFIKSRCLPVIKKKKFITAYKSTKSPPIQFSGIEPN